MDELITVIVPNREGESSETTLKSLALQTFPYFKIGVVFDEGRGANWARNEGFRRFCDTSLVLFSDNDIRWEPTALEEMVSVLDSSPYDSYAYGWYSLEHGVRREQAIFCKRSWDESRLRKINYISTMSLIRSGDFPGFDEEIQRLQDWDLWLTMLADGLTGVYTGGKIFSTRRRNGITFGSRVGWAEATRTIKEKHKL